MFGKTRHTGWDPNAFVWSIEKGQAQQFERFFFFGLKRCVAAFGRGASVSATPRSGDEGRDLEIQSDGPLTFGKIEIPQPPNGKRNRVFIECKSTSGQKPNDAFLVDATQHHGQNLTAYILATNGFITPYSHYRAVQAWGQLGARFILLDRARLLQFWHEVGLVDEAIRLNLIPSQLPVIPEASHERLSAASQSIRIRTRQGYRLQTYLTMRNYSASEQRVSLSLASDLTWRSDNLNVDAILGPWEDTTHFIESELEQLDSDAALRFSLSYEGRAHNLTVLAKKAQLILEAPFMGKSHRALQLRLRQKIESAQNLQIISIYGEAGVGKSRVVTEALRPLEGNRFVFRLVCNPVTGRFDFSYLYREIAEAALREEMPDYTKTATLNETLRYLENLSLSAVLLLEDLHHAEPDDIVAIKELVVNPLNFIQPLVLVITGRDDHTFPNSNYFALLDLLANSNRDHVTCYHVESFTEVDSVDLIRAVATDLPDIAVDRINSLGQNNPFIIIEVLQYLLDAGLAKLLSRRVIGVLDPERFRGTEELPLAVDDLYELRIKALYYHSLGQEALLLLCGLSFLGLVISDELLNKWLDERDQDTIDLLAARRFIIRDSQHDRTQFAHENIYHYLRRWLRRPERASAVANQLLEYHALVDFLPDFVCGELLSLAGLHAEAFAQFQPIWAAVQAMTNFSSEELDRSYFAFLPALFISSESVGKTPDEIAKVAAALAYMGVHNFPLLQGEQACAKAEDLLDIVYPSRNRGVPFKMAIHQLRSHALQNMGRTGEALRRMLELEARIKEMVDTAPTVAYDLYDRLQEHYRKANHSEMMDHYGRLAAAACRRSGDEKVEASHLITMAVTKLFSRGQATLDAANRACQAAEKTGIRRFTVFNKLTVLIVSVLTRSNDLRLMEHVYEEAKSLLRVSALNTYSDSIIRLQLLLATLAPHIHESEQEGRTVARMYIAAGQESSVRFGIGLYDWAFDNLAGAIDQWDPSTPGENARRRFENCMERLRRRSLTFVGACSGTYPNVHALANIIRFSAVYRESDAVDLVRREISAYDSRLTTAQDRVRILVKAALDGQAILWPSTNVQMLRLPGDNNYFTPIF